MIATKSGSIEQVGESVFGALDVETRIPLGETCRSSPSVAGGRLYLRTVSHLYSLGGKSS